MVVKEYTTVKVDKDTLRRLREMSPSGNVSGFLRDFSKNTVEPSIDVPIDDLESNVNALKKYFGKQIAGISGQIKDINKQLQHISDEIYALRESLPEDQYRDKYKPAKLERKTERVREELNSNIMAEIAETYPIEYSRYRDMKKRFVEGDESEKDSLVDMILNPDEFTEWMDQGMPEIESPFTSPDEWLNDLK